MPVKLLKAVITCPKCLQTTEVSVPDSSNCDLKQYSCINCGEMIYAQRQWCPNCDGVSVVVDLKSFENGRYTCPRCHFLDKIEPWTRINSSQPKKKEKFLLKVLKKLFKKGPTLAYDSSLTCPYCNMDSVFWEIGHGARKICSMCDKEIK